jgi:hypothetical protein
MLTQLSWTFFQAAKPLAEAHRERLTTERVCGIGLTLQKPRTLRMCGLSLFGPKIP